MITKLLQVTDAAIGAALPVTTRHLLASLKAGQPVVHTGGGNYIPITNDLSGYWSYQRLRGEVSVTSTRLAGDPCEALQATVPLRIVALLDRDTCIEEATELAAILRSSTRQAKSAIGAFSVAFDRLTWSFDQLAAQEFTPMAQIPTNKTVLVMDAVVVVRGKASCMVDCEPVDVTCAIIAAATLEKIRECLGPRLDDLCDIPSILCPLEWTVRDQDGNVLASGTVNDPCATPTLDVQVDCDECEPCPIEVEVRNTDGRVLDSVSIPDPCEQEGPVVLTAPDGSISWDGITFTKVVSGGTIDIDCDTPIPAAYVLDGGSKTGTYKVDGSVNGKPRYRLDANHTLEYSGTRWECIHPGSDDQAALGDEAFPWLADWSGTSLTVTQATIGQYCDDCEPADLCALLGEVLPENVITQVYDCLSEAAQDELDVEVEVNGTLYAALPAAGSVDIPVINTATTPIGTVAPGVDVEIPDSVISVDSTPELNLPATVALNITLNDGTTPVTPVDVDTSTPGVMAIEIAPCPTPPANVLREYTADDTWNKPSSPDFQGVWVLVVGGAGGGASGSVGATNKTGGTGGSGGALVRRWVPAASLAGTESVTIGAGGATATLSAGNNGADTYFGTHAIAKGGIGGIYNGSATQPGPTGGDVLACTPVASGMADSGAPGGQAGRTTANTLAGGDGMTAFAGAAGGGGGGYTTGGGATGGRGGGTYQSGTLTQGGAGGTAGNNGTNGVSDINLNPFGELVASTIGFGTAGGGGGGSGAAGATGGNGGNGGRAAAGGGGGAGTVTAGTGGAGGDGFCIIYEVYG